MAKANRISAECTHKMFMSRSGYVVSVLTRKHDNHWRPLTYSVGVVAPLWKDGPFEHLSVNCYGDRKKAMDLVRGFLANR